MKRRLLLVILVGLASGLMLVVGESVASAQSARMGHSRQAPIKENAHSIMLEGEQTAASTAIRSSRRISIPYGFGDNLPLTAGEKITVSGHGGCTPGEVVTVDVTISQTIGTSPAHGATQFQQSCTGELQTWQVVVMADAGDTFVDGPATACGIATTRDQYGSVTETFPWCKTVRLNWQIYLPVAIR